VDSGVHWETTKGQRGGFTSTMGWIEGVMGEFTRTKGWIQGVTGRQLRDVGKDSLLETKRWIQGQWEITKAHRGGFT
jgi:hypothetical protein